MWPGCEDPARRLAAGRGATSFDSADVLWTQGATIDAEYSSNY
jgi:hypothetical protein